MIKFTNNFKEILLPILKKYQNRYGVKEIHKYFFEILDETKKIFQKKYNDVNGQKWRNESGKMLESLVVYFIGGTIKELGYDITTDDEIINTKDGILEIVGHNFVLKYGKYYVLPDGDIIIFDPQNGEIKIVISCKASVRERFTQTLYWKLKLSLNKRTDKIKMYFITVDKEWNDKKTGFKKPSLDIKEGKEPTKPRILLEYEMDGVYVTREMKDESEKVKMFDKFINDLKRFLK